MKESLRTPGPGAYRIPSTFPMSARDEAPGHMVKRRSSSWRLTERCRGRVADIGNPYSIVPPVVSLFRQHVEGNAAKEPITRSRLTINTMPPVNASGVILKGHGGDVPKGYGPPY